VKWVTVYIRSIWIGLKKFEGCRGQVKERNMARFDRVKLISSHHMGGDIIVLHGGTVFCHFRSFFSRFRSNPGTINPSRFESVFDIEEFASFTAVSDANLKGEFLRKVKWEIIERNRS
jgi:hypothetical protein